MFDSLRKHSLSLEIIKERRRKKRLHWLLGKEKEEKSFCVPRSSCVIRSANDLIPITTQPQCVVCLFRVEKKRKECVNLEKTKKNLTINSSEMESCVAFSFKIFQ